MLKAAPELQEDRLLTSWLVLWPLEPVIRLACKIISQLKLVKIAYFTV